MQVLTPRESRRRLFAFKRHLAAEGSEVNYLNIVAMMDMMSILLVFLLKSWSVSAGNIQITDIEPPPSNIQLPLSEALKVQITPTAVIVEGEAIVPVRNGGIDPSYKKSGANDYLIPPLEDVLGRHANRERKIAGLKQSEWSGEASLIADKSTPYRLLTEVVYTMGQAGFKNYRLVVLKESGE